MSDLGIVGQGLVVSFSADTSIGRVRSIQLPEYLAPRVDFTSLGETNFMRFLPGSPTDPGQAVLDVYFDTGIVLPRLRIIQTMTVTLPIQTPGNTTNATFTGSGFFTALGLGNAQSAQPLMRGMTFSLDGDPEGLPTFTPEGP